MSFNDAGEVLSDNYSVNGLALASQLQYGYDNHLRRNSLNNLSLGGQVFYGYDAASRLASVSDGTNTVSYGYLRNSSLAGTLTFQRGGGTGLTTTRG